MANPEDDERKESRPGSALKTLTPGELRKGLYCPSCGTLHYLDNAKDFLRGRCTECGSPFDLRVKFHRGARREVAYPVLAALISAFIWILFLPGGSNIQPERSLKSALPARQKTAPVATPHASTAVKVEKLPPPPASSAPPKSLAPADKAPVELTPSSVPNQQPPEAPAVGPPAPAAPAQKEEQGPKNVPDRSQPRSNYNDRAPGMGAPGGRSTAPREKKDDLMDIPLPGSGGQ